MLPIIKKKTTHPVQINLVPKFDPAESSIRDLSFLSSFVSFFISEIESTAGSSMSSSRRPQKPILQEQTYRHLTRKGDDGISEIVRFESFAVFFFLKHLINIILT